MKYLPIIAILVGVLALAVIVHLPLNVDSVDNHNQQLASTLIELDE